MFAVGRSSLENEIVGDLNEEFGILPERPEDTSIQELGTLLQEASKGKFGKKSSASIGRMIGSFMPAGFTSGTIRSYLTDRWNLAAGRQDGVLLLALTMQPSKRLPSTEEAQTFWHGVVERYASDLNLPLSSAAPESTEGNILPAIDQQALSFLLKGQKSIETEVLEVLARHVDVRLGGNDRALTDMQQDIQRLYPDLPLIWLHPGLRRHTGAGKG